MKRTIKRKITTRLIKGDTSVPSVSKMMTNYNRAERKRELEDIEFDKQWEAKTRTKINKGLATWGSGQITVLEEQGGCYDLARIARKIAASYKQAGYDVKVIYDYETSSLYSADDPVIYQVSITVPNYKI